MRRVVVLKVVTDIGQRVSCWGCAHLERDTTFDDEPVAGLCTFHALTFESKGRAQRNGCTFWRRRSRGRS